MTSFVCSPWYPITRLPQAFGLRNDKPRITRLPLLLRSLTMTMWGYCHCEQSEAIHKPLAVNTKTKNKKFSIIHQIKELIFNEILIFNFQFIMLRSFCTSWDDKLKWLSKLIIFVLCASIFNFLWIATSCKQLSQWRCGSKFSQWQHLIECHSTTSRDCHRPSAFTMTSQE